MDSNKLHWLTNFITSIQFEDKLVKQLKIEFQDHTDSRVLWLHTNDYKHDMIIKLSSILFNLKKKS